MLNLLVQYQDSALSELQMRTFHVNVPANLTVKGLKAHLSAAHNCAFKADQQICFNGRLLAVDDSMLISEAGLKEFSKLVVTKLNASQSLLVGGG